MSNKSIRTILFMFDSIDSAIIVLTCFLIQLYIYIYDEESVDI